jgi:hypothetical protein
MGRRRRQHCRSPRWHVTSEDIHRAIFGGRKPKKRTIEEMEEGIAEYIRDRYARD